MAAEAAAAAAAGRAACTGRLAGSATRSSVGSYHDSSSSCSRSRSIAFRKQPAPALVSECRVPLPNASSFPLALACRSGSPRGSGEELSNRHSSFFSGSLRVASHSNLLSSPGGEVVGGRDVVVGHAAVASAAAVSVVAAEGPYNVLITGSTKGVGLALAKDFLRAGDKVVITSRSKERVKDTVASLSQEFGSDRVVGTACDVSDAKDVAALADFAVDKLGHIDIWINNAGSNAYSYGPLVDSDASDLEEIVSTNVLGVMLCCRQAMQVMKKQPRGGHIFNMDGAGADGNPTPRFAAYGATKRSLAQFTKSLQAELRMLSVNNVIVHNLSPGMVTTELLMSGANTAQAKFFINALAEPPEEVASFLVPRVRAVPASGSPKSTYIRFLTQPKALSQILARLLFKARKSRYVPEDE